MAGRLIAVAAAALALAGPAAAQTPILEAAVAGLEERQVYVHPRATLLSEEDAERLDQQIEDHGGGPIFIAILPAAARLEADGTSEGVVAELSRRIVTSNPPAVHAAVVGNQFRAVNGAVNAGDLATRAFLTHNEEGVAAVLSDFISRVGDVRSGSASAQEDDEGGLARWLLPLGGAIAALLLYRRYRSQR